MKQKERRPSSSYMACPSNSISVPVTSPQDNLSSHYQALSSNTEDYISLYAKVERDTSTHSYEGNTKRAKESNCSFKEVDGHKYKLPDGSERTRKNPYVKPKPKN